MKEKNSIDITTLKNNEIATLEMISLKEVDNFDLKYISDEALDQSLLLFVKKEKEVLKEVLLHIAEVDRRRLYLKMSYPSLYAYLTERLGYAAGSAQRRLDAARFSHEVPEVIESLASGEVNLAQVTFLQKNIRESEKAKAFKAGFKKTAPLSKVEKVQLLEELKHKSFQETQIAVSKALHIEIKESPKILHQANESVRLEVTLSPEQWAKLQEMRRLLSNSLPYGGWDQVLEYLAEKVITQKSRVPAASTEKVMTQQNKVPGTGAYFSLRTLKQTVLKRDSCCQYKDLKTGRVCGSKWNLEVDHIKPRWAGGADALENLRVLCSNHNKELYRQQANIKRG